MLELQETDMPGRRSPVLLGLQSMALQHMPVAQEVGDEEMRTELILVKQDEVPLRQIAQMCRDGWGYRYDEDDDVLIFWREVSDVEVRR